MHLCLNMFMIKLVKLKQNVNPNSKYFEHIHCDLQLNYITDLQLYTMILMK